MIRYCVLFIVCYLGPPRDKKNKKLDLTVVDLVLGRMINLTTTVNCLGLGNII